MTPYRLDQVVGSMLAALSEAQHISDQYTEWLQKEYASGENTLSVMAVPSARLELANIELQYAVASIEPPSAESGNPAPTMYVYVAAPDLATLPCSAISTMKMSVRVTDAETLELPPQQPAKPEGKA